MFASDQNIAPARGAHRRRIAGVEHHFGKALDPPRVNVNGNVRLDIEQEISDVANSDSSATLTPTVSQRRVKSSISVASGKTVLLARLISERRSGTGFC